MIDLALASSAELRERLAQHPRIRAVGEQDDQGITFHQGEWKRRVVENDPACELFGLIELMDNNPLVCADVASVPSPLGTLAMVALGPLAVAGIIAEPPVVLASREEENSHIAELLSREGWSGGATIEAMPLDTGKVDAITTISVIRAPSDWSEIDELYDERFGRSFFVRRSEDGEWDTRLVGGQPYALYRLQYSPPDDGLAILTVRAMADRYGKCGPDRLIHAMNVMAGFEESLGIA